MVEEKAPRTYSENDVKRIVRQSVLYVLRDVHKIALTENKSLSPFLLSDILFYRARQPFAATVEAAYRECLSFPKTLLQRMKQEGLDTTHLE